MIIYSNYNILFFIIFITFNFSFIFVESDTLDKESESSTQEIWDPDSLYNYTKINFLDSNNPNKTSNLKHMIVDPENYLNVSDITKIYQIMEMLYDKLKINSYIFLISHMEISSYKLKQEEYINMKLETERFLSKFNYMMYRDNSFYEDNMTLTVIFFLKDKEIRVRTGRSLRKIIQDKDALNIINMRNEDLIEENYDKVVYEFVNDIYNTYISNFELYNSFLYKNKEKIFFSIIFLIIGIILYIYIINYVPESEREDKIKEFLYRNKDKKVKTMFNQACIICLDYFMPERDKLKIENLLDKKKLKREKTNLLECGHKFHERCIIQWLKTQNKCPICRISIKYEENNIKPKKENKSDEEAINFLSFDNDYKVDNIVDDIVHVQKDAYPHLISEAQEKKIISNYREEENAENNSYLNDKDNELF